MGIPLLAPGDYAFPNPAHALSEYEGLVGVSRDLDSGRLLEAYRNGVFPWFSRDGWFFWYAVGPRAVIARTSARSALAGENAAQRQLSGCG